MSELTPSSNRLPVLAAEINAEYLAARRAAECALEHAVVCGRHLLEAKSLLSHGEWLPWLGANTQVVPRQSQKYMRLAENWGEIEPQANSGSHLSINDALAVIADRKGHHPMALCTGNPEWYTPVAVLDAVRATFGGEITLDPASCPFAQERVQAKVFFDEQADGLAREWHGKVFLNPPYNAPIIRAFVDKLISELRCGNVQQAIMLADDRTDAGWFQQATAAADIFAFTRKRVNFYSPERGETAGHLCNSVLFYFGTEPERFRSAFADMACFCRLVDRAA